MENSGFRAFPNLWNVTPVYFPPPQLCFCQIYFIREGMAVWGTTVRSVLKGLPTLYSSGSQSFLVALENLVAEIPPSI